MKTTKTMDNDIFHFLNSLGLVWKYVVNGIIGGIIFSIYRKSKIVDAIRQVIIGGIVAGYFTPVIVAKTSINMSYVGFTSFVIGLSGMTILDSVYKYVVKLIKKWSEAIMVINKK